MKYQIQPTQVPDDLNSCWFHPDIEKHDTIGENAEFYTKEQWAQLQINLGVEILVERLEYWDIPEIPEDDCADWSNWKPQAPIKDAFLIAGFDTEDGPCLWWAKPKAESKEGEMLLTTDEVELIKTCDESPEQYIAVFQGQQIGYLRLRHGEFRVDYPDCGDETILYSQEPQGDGCFEEDEREYFLMKAKKAIVKKFNEMEG